MVNTILTTSVFILFAVAAVFSSIGFYKYIYFISLGYGFSIAGLGVALLIIYAKNLTIGTIAICVLLILYGCRLGMYLLIREIKSSSYNNVMKKEVKDGKTVSIGAKIGIWLGCVVLYVLQISPVYYRFINNSGTDTLCIIGAVIMLFGLAFESLADMQKSNLKKINSGRFCDTGLYKLVRCPNYLGEVIFWTGVLVSAVTSLNSIGQWIVALLGYLGIVYIMFSGARRLEIRQNRNYGSDPEYQEYVKKTPILLPLIPLYSVEKYKFLIG